MADPTKIVGKEALTRLAALAKKADDTKVTAVAGKSLVANELITKIENLAEIKSVGANLTLNPSTGELTANAQEITVDSELSNVSENPIQNKAVDKAVSELEGKILELGQSVVADLAGYYTKEETYSQSEINERISQIPKFAIQVVSTLPSSEISDTTIYLVKTADDSGNVYTEYIRVNGAWEELGTQKLDLTNYVQKSELAEVATSGSYEDLDNKPTIPTVPTNVSAFTNDAEYVKASEIATLTAKVQSLESLVNTLSEKVARVPQVLSGTTEPNSATGEDGDLYIQVAA